MKFRKLIAASAALCLAAPAASNAMTAWATQPIAEVIAGDVNVDYTFNLADIVLFQCSSLLIKNPVPEEM